jgi:hypothetical protein
MPPGANQTQLSCCIYRPSATQYLCVAVNRRTISMIESNDK